MRRLSTTLAVEQYAEGHGELLVCPICFNARKLDEKELLPNARLAGATPMLEWIADDDASIFSYWEVRYLKLVGAMTVMEQR